MLSGESNEAKELISALTSFHIKKKTYPKGFGEGLINLVRALPPEIRRFKIDFPLMTISKLTAVGQYARESDGEDLQLLFSAIFREQFELSKKVAGRYQSTENTDEGQFESQLDLLKSEIDADALAFKFGIPIDSARASFTLESVRLKESQNLTEIATSFYIHLLRHTQNIKGVVSVRNAEAEALALIERTFSTKGGFRGAIAEAKHATNGGLRMILDMLTEEYKHELKKQHVSYVLKSALDPLDWESKVSLITEIMKTLQHVLPKKIKSQPPERFAGHYELIVNAYVDSINKLDMIFRRL